MEGTIWLTWESQRRNREICRALGIPLFEWADLEKIPGRARRYARGLVRTTATIKTVRPRVVICQNPSIFLTALVLVLRSVWRYRVVVDAHNAGLLPLEGRSRVLGAIAGWTRHHADLTVVTNEGLRPIVEDSGGRAFVMQDPIPDLKPRQDRDSHRCSPIVLFVCSFAVDEPVHAVIESARYLSRRVTLLITGDPLRFAGRLPEVPSNVELTGFLTDQDYVDLLFSVDAVVDLTSRENCLVCGAYEGIAAGCPLVLSDTLANRQQFDRGCVFTRHDPGSIADAIDEALARAETLREEISELRKRMDMAWAERRLTLRSVLLQLGA